MSNSDFFRPSPWEIVCGLNRWNGDEDKLDHIIMTRDMTIIHAPKTVDQINRLELSPRLAMMNRKVFGYIAGIHEEDNVGTPSLSPPTLSCLTFQIPRDPTVMTAC